MIWEKMGMLYVSISVTSVKISLCKQRDLLQTQDLLAVPGWNDTVCICDVLHSFESLRCVMTSHPWDLGMDESLSSFSSFACTEQGTFFLHVHCPLDLLCQSASCTLTIFFMSLFKAYAQHIRAYCKEERRPCICVSPLSHISSSSSGSLSIFFSLTLTWCLASLPVNHPIHKSQQFFPNMSYPGGTELC